MIIPVRIDPLVHARVVGVPMLILGSHPLAEHDCPVCDETLADRLASLVYVGREPNQSGTWTGAAVAVHRECAS